MRVASPLLAVWLALLASSCARSPLNRAAEFDAALSALPATVAAPESALRWHEELEAADLQLDSASPWTSCSASPATWAIERRKELASTLELTRPVLTKLRDLASTASQVGSASSVARLALVRHRTNHMCAAAVVSESLEDAKRWLEAAIHLASVSGDQSTASASIRVCAGDIVLQAARQIALERAVDIESFRPALEPSLALMRSPESAGRAVAHDLQVLRDHERQEHANRLDGRQRLSLVHACESLLRGDSATAIARFEQVRSGVDPVSVLSGAARGLLDAQARLVIER